MLWIASFAVRVPVTAQVIFGSIAGTSIRMVVLTTFTAFLETLAVFGRPPLASLAFMSSTPSFWVAGFIVMIPVTLQVILWCVASSFIVPIILRAMAIFIEVAIVAFGIP